MAISITSSEVTLTNDEYTLEDIYEYALDNNITSVNKLGNSYKINIDLVLKDDAILKDLNKYIEIHGDYIRIEKGCTLQLGEITNNGQTINGCYLYAPNVKFKYGFGCATTSNSGNLLAYNSTIVAWCFWSFFEGNNRVDLIDCKITGFGRLSGATSRIFNVELKYAEGKYGGLALYGGVDIFDKVTIKNSLPNKSNKVVLYHNPKYSGNMLITNNILAGYDKLAYIEDLSGGDTLELLDCKIEGGLELERETNNVDLIVSYTFSPKILKDDASGLSNANVVCKDKDANEVFNVQTSTDGGIDEKLIYYFNDRDDTVQDYKNPYTVTITKDDDSMEFDLYIDKPMKGIPIYFKAGGSGGGGSSADVDYDKIQGMINTLKDQVCECTEDVKTAVESGNTNINQVLLALGDEVNENQAIIESKSGNTRMYL